MMHYGDYMCVQQYTNDIFEENYIFCLILERCKLNLGYVDHILLIWTGTSHTNKISLS